MELKKEEYTISRKLLTEVLDALGNNWFSSCGNQNNDDIIEAEEKLKREIEKQDT